MRNLVPEKGWLRDYLEYTKSYPEELTEVPMIFNFFIGLVVIGATLKRRICVSRGAYELYPDIRVVLIAPTGKGKKTTAINRGRGLIEEAQHVKVLSEIVTPEALCDALSSHKVVLKGGRVEEEQQDAVGLLILPELSVFLDKRDYKSGLVPLLTRLGDAPDFLPTETIGRGKHPLRNVALTMMAGSAKSWLTDSIPIDAFRGGFMSRFLFVVSEGVAYPVPHPPPLDKSLRRRLLSDLEAISKLEGVMFLDEEAEEFFDSWYNEAYHHRSLDEKRAAYQERKHDHLARVAMLLAVSERKSKIEKADVSRALKMLDIIETEMFSLFGEIERGCTPQGEAMQMVLSYVKKRGVIGRTDLLRRVISHGITASTVDEIIASLVAGGYIEIIRRKAERGRQATLYQYNGEERIVD